MMSNKRIIIALCLLTIAFIPVFGDNTRWESQQARFSIVGGTGVHVVDGWTWTIGGGAEMQWRPPARNGYNGSFGFGLDALMSGTFDDPFMETAILSFPIHARAYMGVGRHDIVSSIGPEMIVFDGFSRVAVLGSVGFGFSLNLRNQSSFIIELRYGTDFKIITDHDYLSALLRYVF